MTNEQQAVIERAIVKLENYIDGGSVAVVKSALDDLQSLFPAEDNQKWALDRARAARLDWS